VRIAMRTFVIINNHNSANIQENIIGKLDPESNIIVFKPDNNYSDDEAINFPNVKIQQFPSDIMEHDTKLKNFVSKTLIDCKIGGFVHVIEDDVKIIGDTNAFLVEIEKMMTALNLKSWFNTSCDIVNYVYQKYNPRFYITIDEKQFMLKYDKTIAWCSNANTVWICYDMDKIVYDDIRFEEKFTVPVYYIIEFLARRRNSKKPGELYYMNLYPSVPEELKVFTLDSSVTKQSHDEEYVKKENEIFNTMNINYVADNDINIIMEDIMKVLS
jgi:hypothetical protein